MRCPKYHFDAGLSTDFDSHATLELSMWTMAHQPERQIASLNDVLARSARHSWV